MSSTPQLDPIYKPIKLGAHTVPGVWAYMFPDDLPYFQVDPEVRSSCFNCPQIKAAGFHPAIRCCTVIPRVPNFLMGMILEEGSSAAILEPYIHAGYTLPEGSNISPEQLKSSLEYIVRPKREDPQIFCPFLNQKSRGCGIYGYRSTVCSTFFCHHDHGETGQIFWEDLQDLGSQIETAIAQWAMDEIGFDRKAYFERFNQVKDYALEAEASAKAWPLAIRSHLWAEYFGRETDFYRACARVVVANKKNLFEIASKQKILQSKDFDNILRKDLEEDYPAHLVAEALPFGEAEEIKNLWYSTQLSQRNLKLARQKS